MKQISIATARADPEDSAVFDETGLLNAAPSEESAFSPTASKLESAVPRRRWFRHPILLLVLLPTALVAAYEYLVVADQYQSEARFIVRGVQPSQTGGALSQMLGLGGGQIPADAHSVSDYLVSHDALAALGKSIDLPTLFRRPEADPITRLRDKEPAPETLLRYFRGQVDVRFDSESGITRLDIRAFRPADAKLIADNLLQLGEKRVNALNTRMLQDGLAAATRQLQEAETQAAEAQTAMTEFRQSQRDIDPERTGTAQIGMATELETQAAQAQAQLNSMRSVLSPSAPQVVAMEHQVRALEGQVAAARSRIAGPPRSTAAGLGDFEELRLKQEFSARRYEAAAISLQNAREQIARQQLFIVRVVEPNLPVKALYPKRIRTVATAFFGLLLAYAIGWLLLAGVREHAE